MKSPAPPLPRPSLPALEYSGGVESRAQVNEEQLAAALKYHWFFIRTELKENYLSLTDEDLNFAEGGELEFLAHLERKTGRDRNEFYRLILQGGGIVSR